MILEKVNNNVGELVGPGPAVSKLGTRIMPWGSKLPYLTVLCYHDVAPRSKLRHAGPEPKRIIRAKLSPFEKGAIFYTRSGPQYKKKTKKARSSTLGPLQGVGQNKLKKSILVRISRISNSLRLHELPYKVETWIGPFYSMTTVPVKREIQFRIISLIGFPAQSVRSSNTITLDSSYLLVLITGTSQSRQDESCKSPTVELFDVDFRRISIVTMNTKDYHSDVLAIITRIIHPSSSGWIMEQDTYTDGDTPWAKDATNAYGQ
ncbi:hypothetical protein Tco_0090500 [Tanacetum coccineum]